MKILLVVLVLSVSGCASMSAAERRRIETMACIKELRDGDTSVGVLAEVFEVCRQLHQMKKVKD